MEHESKSVQNGRLIDQAMNPIRDMKQGLDEAKEIIERDIEYFKEKHAEIKEQYDKDVKFFELEKSELQRQLQDVEKKIKQVQTFLGE